MEELRAQGKYVFTKHLPGESNPADKLAEYAMKEGRRLGWPRQERIPLIDDVAGLRDVLRTVGYLTQELERGRLTIASVLKNSKDLS